jgi:hypothetical protein
MDRRMPMDAYTRRSCLALFVVMVATNASACDDAKGGAKVQRGKPIPAIACAAAVKFRIDFDMTQPGRRPENEPPCPQPPALRQPVDAFEPNELARLFA